MVEVDRNRVFVVQCAFLEIAATNGDYVEIKALNVSASPGTKSDADFGVPKGVKKKCAVLFKRRRSLKLQSAFA